MSAIKLKFKNYKLFEDKEFSLEGKIIYLIKGKNDTGKTTFKNAVKALQTAKLADTEPVTLGKEEGSIEAINLIGADGKKYIIRCTFDKAGNSKFVAIDEGNNKISSVTKIRDIFKYNSFTAEEFMQMSMTAKGREEAKKIFLSFLDEDQKKEYEKAILLEEKYYDERTKANSQKDTFEKLFLENKLSDEETKNVSNAQDITSLLKQLKEEYSSFQVNEEKEKNRLILYNQAISDKKSLENKILLLKNEISQLENEIEKKNTIIKDNKEGPALPDISSLKERITKGEELYNSLNEINIKRVNQEKYKAEFDKYSALSNELTDKIKSMRTMQDKIIQESKNPIKELRLTEQGLKYGELSFNENQINKATAMLIGAEIQCAINDCPILIMGSANDLDTESLNKMYKIAEKYNRVMIYDEVIRENKEIYIEGYDYVGESEKKGHLKQHEIDQLNESLKQKIIEETGKSDLF